MKINNINQNVLNITAKERRKFDGALEDFESLFLYHMLKKCFNPNIGNAPGSHIYKDFIREALSTQLAKSGGIGLADSLRENFISSPINNKKLPDIETK